MNLRTINLAAILAAATATAIAAEWHVTQQGTPTGSGAKDSPWDITTALEGKHTVAPGDTIWIHAGTYKAPAEPVSRGFKVQLAGREGAPIHVRAVRGERVTIDGGLDVQPPSTQIWIWDLEILVSEPRPSAPIPPDPSYKSVNRPWGGLNVYSGSGNKFINLVIHDNCQGVSWWTPATDNEMHGCIIYDNGWPGTDRGHGHAIYTQNKDGVKTISDCIMTGGFGMTMHAYGSSRAFVDNFLVEGNIAYNAGTFLIGGGKPSHDIRVISNCLYKVAMQIGYNAPTNENCEVRDNVVAYAGLSINLFNKIVSEGNTQQQLAGARVILRPNKYDLDRANLAVFNWDRQPTVDVDAAAFLKRGEKYRLLDPRDFFGKPVMQDVHDGKPIRIPVKDDFAAFVLLREHTR